MIPEQSLKAFVAPFNIDLPELIVWKARRAFLINDQLEKVMHEIKEEPMSMGLPLGEATPKGFKPSFALLDLMKDSPNKMTIKNEAEWLFTCGRDVFLDKVKESGKLQNTFLIMNEREEVLGLGKKEYDGKNKFIKNVFDRGDFLRREEKKKRRK